MARNTHNTLGYTYIYSLPYKGANAIRHSWQHAPIGDFSEDLQIKNYKIKAHCWLGYG